MKNDERILVILSYPRSGFSMLRYSNEITLALSEIASVRFIRPSLLAATLANSRGQLAKWLKYIDKYIVFSIKIFTLTRISKYDTTIVTDQGDAIWNHFIRAKKKLIVCHDFFAIQAAQGKIPGVKVKWLGRLLQYFIFLGIENANVLICVSSSTRETARQLFPKKEYKLLYNCLNPNWKSYESKILPLSKRQLITILSTSSWRKNRSNSLDVAIKLAKTDSFRDCKLMIIGDSLTNEELNLVNRGQFNIDHLSVLHSIDDYELSKIYRNTRLLVHLSTFEGFGYPLLEASFFKCLVLASDIPSFREIRSFQGNNILICKNSSDIESIEFELDAIMKKANLDQIDWVESSFSFNIFKQGWIDVMTSLSVPAD